MKNVLHLTFPYRPAANKQSWHTLQKLRSHPSRDPGLCLLSLWVVTNIVLAGITRDGYRPGDKFANLVDTPAYKDPESA